jgi:hypothetical protein
MGTPIAPITLAVLRHLRVHGISSVSELKASLPELHNKTLNNLHQLNHVARTGAGYQITAKGRAKLLSAEGEASTGLKGNTAEPPQALPMLSNAEVETAITTVLARSIVRLSLPDISRRTMLAEHIVRPTLTTMVQQSKVEGTSGKPAMYRLVQQSARQLNTHMGRGPADYPSGYTCPELARNPGIEDERFAAFALPSRVNDRLYYPDGRVEPFPNMREVVAA